MSTLIILAVDDSPSMREMLAAVLRDSGYQVVEAEDGVKALELAKTRSIDVVLTDQNMPNMDGLSLVKNLRGLPAYKDTPIMMLTTESSAEMKQKGRDAGATGWMVKPFDPGQARAHAEVPHRHEALGSLTWPSTSLASPRPSTRRRRITCRPWNRCWSRSTPAAATTSR
jgi:two-component system chemotaxis response regulator CheY